MKKILLTGLASVALMASPNGTIEQTAWTGNILTITEDAHRLGSGGVVNTDIDFSHLAGNDGNNGKDGKDGKDGTNGKDGVDGTNGTNGTNGNDGMDGSNGSDGVDGKDAVDYTAIIEEYKQELDDMYQYGVDVSAGAIAVSSIDFGSVGKGETEIGMGVGVSGGGDFTGYAGALGIKHGLTDEDAVIGKAWYAGHKNYAVGAGLTHKF
jgi:hypothetical protein